MPIANELVEALARTRVPGEVGQVLWALIRLTYGWNKKEEKITLNQIIELTGLGKSVVSRSLANLLTMEIITKKEDGKHRIFGLQKDYEQWKGSKSATHRKVANLLPSGSKSANNRVANLLPNNTTTIQRQSKDILSKTEPPIPPLKSQGSKSATHHKVANLLPETLTRFEQIWKRYPKKVEKPFALERFQKSVVTEKDWLDINTALDNYLAHLERERHDDFYPVKNGCVWFNGKVWRRWIEIENTTAAPPDIPEDVRAVIDAYKEVNGFQTVVGWDENFAADCITPAEKLLKMAEGNTGLIREGLAAIKRYFGKNKLSWKLSTAVDWFPRWLAEQE